MIDLDELVRSIKGDMPELARLFRVDNSGDPYGVSMLHLASIMLILQACKDAGYGSSWAKRGESGVFHNTMRKSDRLEQLALIVMSNSGSDEHGVSLVDNLMDLSAYCMMWVSYIAKVRPADFTTWLRDKWCKVTGVAYDDVVKFLEDM